MAKKINVLDPTIREVGFINNFNFSLKQVKNLASALEKAGCNWIELGHGNGLGNTDIAHTHEEYIAAVKNEITNAKISVFALSNLCTPDLIKSTADSGLDCIRIGFVGFDTDFPLIGVHKLVDAAKENDLRVSVNMLESGRYDEADLARILKELNTLPIDMLYVVDSAGAMLPNQVAQQVEFICANSNFEVGFHGHMQMGMANANSIKAVESGAKWVDGTMLGAGRGPGNAQTEVLVAILERLGYETGIDWLNLSKSAHKILKPMLPETLPLSSDEIALGYYGIMDFAKPWIVEIAKENNVDVSKLMEQMDKDKSQYITKDKIIESLKKIQ